jgi:hypothetical protein
MTMTVWAGSTQRRTHTREGRWEGERGHAHIAVPRPQRPPPLPLPRNPVHTGHTRAAAHHALPTPPSPPLTLGSGARAARMVASRERLRASSVSCARSLTPDP